MASSGHQSLEGNREEGAPDPTRPTDVPTSSQSRLPYNCQLIPHLPMEYRTQVNRLLEAECPTNEQDFVQVDLVAAHPGASYASSHECYAVVTSSRSGAEPEQVEPNVGLESCPVITLFRETAFAEFAVNGLTEQNFAKIEKQACRLQLAECGVINTTNPQSPVIRIAGSCSQIQLFREYLVKLLVKSALLVGGEDVSTSQVFPSQHVKKLACQENFPTNAGPLASLVPPSSADAVAPSGDVVPPSPMNAVPLGGVVSPSSTESKPDGQSFTGLSSEVLYLMPKLPNGNIAGVEYFPEEGRVHITCASKEEEEACISQFQSVYQKTVSSRHMKTATIPVPPTFPEENLQPLVEKFNGQYNQCHFLADSSNKNIRVLSVSSRQFDQAKKFLIDSLHGNEAAVAASTAGMCEVIRLPQGRKLTLKRADIAKERVEVIVNAANSQLAHGGGVALALDKASHGELQKHSNQYIKRKGEVPAGGVCVTKGGGSLKCKHVIHAVGPMASAHPSDLMTAEMIFSAVSKSLVEAQKLSTVSIAFPAISAGMFGIKGEVSAEAILHAILTYKYPENRNILSDIRIVIIDEPTHTCFANMMAKKQAEMEKEKETVDQKVAIPVSTSPGPSFPTTAGAAAIDSQGHDPSTTSSAPFMAANFMNGRDASQGTSTTSIDSVLAGSHPAITSTVMFPGGGGGASSSPSTSKSPILLTPGKLTSHLPPHVVSSMTTASASTALTQLHGLSTTATLSTATGLGGAAYSTMASSGTGGTRTTPHTASAASALTRLEGGASSQEASGCPICLEKYPINPVKMPCCQQIFCKACSDRAFQTSPYCSVCRKPLRAVVGNQPKNATMSHYVSHFSSLPGYPGVGIITITYHVPDGTQTREHPNPGKRYHGTSRTAYLPDNAEGREVLQLLQRAFEARLIFTVGTSHTSGLSDVVTWNDIHHKTTTSRGTFGYPDPTYLSRVKEELKAKGIF